MTFVKFCGMTQERDVAVACELGADAVGFVLWPHSPRFVPAERLAALVRLLPHSVTPVGVFVRPDDEEISAALDAGVRVIQLHGVDPAKIVSAEPPGQRWVAASVDVDLSALPADVTVVLDTVDPQRFGGTGRTVDWHRAATIAAHRRVVLAGGLTVANVGEAIRQVRPFGVDVASGIEDQPGIKNESAMRGFIAAVRKAEQ